MTDPRNYNPNPMPPGGMTFSPPVPDPDSTIISNKTLKRIKRRWFWAIPAFCLGLGLGLASGPSKSEAPIQTLPTIKSSTPAPAKNGPATQKPSPKTYMAQDGTYLVGENIAPGTYRNGSVDTDLCGWARLKGTSGDVADIITGGFGPNQVVTIKKTDRAFKVTGCGPWILLK